MQVTTLKAFAVVSTSTRGHLNSSLHFPHASLDFEHDQINFSRNLICLSSLPLHHLLKVQDKVVMYQQSRMPAKKLSPSRGSPPSPTTPNAHNLTNGAVSKSKILQARKALCHKWLQPSFVLVHKQLFDVKSKRERGCLCEREHEKIRICE